MGRRRRKKLHIHRGDPWIDVVRGRRPQRPLKMPQADRWPLPVMMLLGGGIGILILVAVMDEAASHPILVITAFVLLVWWKAKQ
jgi:hypothetical protein